MSGEAALDVQNLDVRYGSWRALFDVSLRVRPGSIVAVLGANGAGKSSLGRALSGLVPPTAGQVMLEGRDITGWPAHRIRRAGLTYIPEGRAIFPGLSVLDNVRMSVRQLPGKAERHTAIATVFELFPVLGERQNQRAGSLSGGEQQMLALGGALGARPKVLIADEMSLGLAPRVVDLMLETLAGAARAGTAVVLIEQFVHRAIAIVDDCVILSRGATSWSGAADQAGDEVLNRYLGAGP